MTVTLLLTNFKKYSNATFTFPENGLSLLDGKSGAGKTSILKAITYALFGKTKKPCSYGTSTCSVSLEIYGMKITRTTKPNVLTVIYKEKKYQGEGAQGIIEATLGLTEQKFLLGSSLTKKNLSILSLTPTEQLKFIETVALYTGNMDPADIKNKIKNKIKVYTDAILRNNTEVENFSGLLLKLQEKMASKPVLNSVRPMSDILNDLTKTKKASTELSASIKKLELSLSKLKTDAKNIERDKIEYTKNKNLVEKYKRDLQEDINIDIEKIVIDLAYNQDLLSKLLLIEKYITKKKLFTDNKNKFLAERDEKLKSLLVDEIEVQAVNDDLRECKRLHLEQKVKLDKYNEQQDKKDEAHKQVKLLAADIRKKLGKDVNDAKLRDIIRVMEIAFGKFKKSIAPVKMCPCCQTKLIYLDENLLEYDNNVVPEKDTRTLLTKEWFMDTIAKLNTCVNDFYLDPIEPPSLDFDLLEKERLAVEINARYAEYSKLLSDKDFPSFLLDMKKECDLLEKRVSILVEGNISIDKKIATLVKDVKNIAGKICKLNTTIESLQKEKLAIENNIARKNKLQHEMDKLISANEKLEAMLSADLDSQIVTLEEKIKHEQQKYITDTKKLATLERELSTAKEAETWASLGRDIKNMQKRIDDATSKLEESQCLLDGFTSLEQDAKKASVLAIENVLDKINFTAAEYIKKMFDCVLQVELFITDNNKINVNVAYQGFSSTLDDLSDGEFQRCELAFCLAINDLLGSSILLMDECLNHLGSESQSEILLDLKDLCKNKFVLVISHQEIDAKEDIYSSIINL